MSMTLMYTKLMQYSLFTKKERKRKKENVSLDKPPQGQNGRNMQSTI